MSTAYTNPYDFERPVKDPRLFAGRQKELGEIDYYLELSRSNRPVYHNLALIGTRSIGKTSLLNMIEHMAEKKGMLAVKVSLNNDTASNEVLLFKEIFDNALTKGVEKGMYGGVSGGIYRLFRKAIDLFDASVEIPLLFATAYIGLKKSQNTSLSQQVLTHDLSAVYQEAHSMGIPTIILLFDECDLLAQNRTLLQKVRNAFSELDGYILVFTGTEKMFPDMTEVFSPIPRMFKRIDVGNFRSIEETQDCIIKPLTEDEGKLVDRGSIAEIHLISNGIPYEVQLLSHFMYRRFKERNASSISLDVEVLENVLNDLERLRIGGHHEIANRIRRLMTSDQLRVILATLEFPGATVQQLAKLLVLAELDSTDLNDISSKTSFYELILSGFVDSIIKKDDEGRLAFAGDQFDILYLKHFALSKGIKEFHFGIPNEPDTNVQNKFTNVLLKDIDEYDVDVRFDRVIPLGTQDGFKGRKAIFGGKFKPKAVKPGEWTTVFTFSPAEVDKRFYQGSPDAYRFRVNVNFLESGYVIQITTKKPEDLEYIRKRVAALNTKLQVLGFDILTKDEIEYNLEGIKHLEKKDYPAALVAFDSSIKLNDNFELAWANKGRIYFEVGRYDQALQCFERWSNIRPRLGEAWERVGATLIHLLRYEEARKALQKAAELKPELWVTWDNLGRALFNLRRYDEAIEAEDKALALKPDNPGAKLFKGMSLHNLGKMDDATKLYDEVLLLDPNNVDALTNKGISMRQKGEYDSALEFFVKSLGLNPKNSVVLVEQALIYDRKGMQNEAIESCNKILALNPNDSIAYFNRACFNCTLGNVDQALSDLKEAIDLDPRSKDLAKNEKDFEKIKDDQRFRQLIS